LQHRGATHWQSSTVVCIAAFSFRLGNETKKTMAAFATPVARGTKLETVLQYVRADVPSLDPDAVTDAVELAPDGSVRFHCPCFRLRDSIGGQGSNQPRFVTVVKRQRLTAHLSTASHIACECCCVATFSA
jgi:hypothetical protein